MSKYFSAILLILTINLQAQTVMHIWKNGAKIDSVQITNDLKLTFSQNQQVINPELEVEMVTVEGGTFMMGSDDGEDDEKPVHQVTVKSFYIGKYEVTQKEWKEIMEKNPSYFKGDNLPVEQVSWHDIQDFIKTLNQKTGKNYRLPTEAEWEYAAKGGNKSMGYKYSGSNNIGDVAWYSSNSGSKTHEVGTKQPNELGIYDMSGNVFEWCNDWYSGTYYSISPSTNPPGPSSGTYRVLRGGSWINYGNFCRSACRFNYPGSYINDFGFRLALDL